MCPSAVFTFTWQAWLNFTFPHSGWKTVFIEARCVPMSCLIMFLDRIPQLDHNMFQIFTKCTEKPACFALFYIVWFQDRGPNENLKNSSGFEHFIFYFTYLKILSTFSKGCNKKKYIYITTRQCPVDILCRSNCNRLHYIDYELWTTNLIRILR